MELELDAMLHLLLLVDSRWRHERGSEVAADLSAEFVNHGTFHVPCSDHLKQRVCLLCIAVSAVQAFQDNMSNIRKAHRRGFLNLHIRGREQDGGCDSRIFAVDQALLHVI